VFTGIVEGMGHVAALESREGDLRLTVAADGLDLSATRIGHSIAVNGACLTVVALPAGAFAADVSRETLSATTLGGLAPGTRVNLERAIVLGAPLGGHLVTGHVDGVGRLEDATEDARSVCMRFSLPVELARYVARKGSICVDGVSLTVNAVAGSRFEVNIVPHTLAATTLGERRPGDAVNIEVDLLARYLERLSTG
jgi:riboflavin synthase